MWIAVVVLAVSPVPPVPPEAAAKAVAVHYAENAIGCSWFSDWKQLRLMLNRDGSLRSRQCWQPRRHRGKLKGSSRIPSVLLWQEIDAPSGEATGFVCASTRTSSPSYKCQAIAAQKPARQARTVLPPIHHPARILTQRMKVPLSVGLLTITLAIDTDTVAARATVTLTVTATAMATDTATATAPASNTSYTCRTFLGPNRLLACLSAFSHYCVYIFLFVLCQTPKYKPARTHSQQERQQQQLHIPNSIHNPLDPLDPLLRHISSFKLCLPVRGILCFLLLPVA